MTQRPRAGVEPRDCPRDSQSTGCIQCLRGATREKTSRVWGGGGRFGERTRETSAKATGRLRKNPVPSRSAAHRPVGASAPPHGGGWRLPLSYLGLRSVQRNGVLAGDDPDSAVTQERGDARCHLPQPRARRDNRTARRARNTGGKTRRSPPCSLCWWSQQKT